MRRLVFTLILLLPISLLAQTSYYVSNNGNDSNSGTSQEKAWRTLDKVNSFTPKPGDQILFNRGNEWEGTITVKASGTSGGQITYGAYGSGDKPKLYGSKVITGWKLHSGNIYKASFNSDIHMLFINNKRLQIARYPNSGLHKISKVNTSTQFISSDLENNINYKGSTWVGRTKAWSISKRVVTASTNQTISLSSAPNYSFDIGEGFFLLNKMEFLDFKGEWFYDNSSNTVYLWTPNGDSPSNYTIRASVFDYGVNIEGNSYITVENLDLRQQSNTAIYTKSGTRINIANNDILNSDQIGINIAGGTFNRVTKNTVTGSNDKGIKVASNNATISGNSISDIMLHKNIGLSGAGNGSAIMLLGDNATISYNVINNSGYNGIEFRGTNSLIEKNVIKNVCETIDDGGGIYTFTPGSTSPGSTGSVIRFNIIDGVKGTNFGSTKKSLYGNGIYMDDRTSGVQIYNNLVTNCSYYGLYLHNNKDINISNNTVFNCAGNYRITERYSAGGNKIRNNTFVNGSSAKHTAFLGMLPSEHSKIATIDNNKYVDHHRSNVFVNASKYSKTTFSSWKSTMNQDNNSTFDNSPLGEKENEVLFYNETKKTKEINFGGAIYKELNGQQVSGSISLEPFTSRILIKTTSGSVSINHAPSIQDQEFDLNGNIQANTIIGKVSASDPDNGQTLTYAIINGNGSTISINPSNGELFSNTEISTNTDNTISLTVQVSDNASSPLSATADISINIKGSNQPTTPQVDNTAPQISTFNIPSTYSSLSVPVSSFTASDNVGVSGYLLTTNSSTPSATDNNWSSNSPTNYSFSKDGTQTLYAWVKDAAGNISTSQLSTVKISIVQLKSASSKYMFEETSGNSVLDSEGTNNGTILKEELRVDGIKGYGLQFTGNGCVSLGQCFGENVNNQLTLSAWIKPTSTDNNFQGVIMHGGPNIDSFALYVKPSDNTIGFKTTGTSNSWTTTKVSNMDDGNWHHLAVTYNGSQKTIYFDNVNVKEIQASGNIEFASQNNLLIGAGRDTDPSDLLYKGLIDEVHIYNSVLSKDELKSLFDINSNTTQPETPSNNSPVINNQTLNITDIKQTNDVIGSVQATDPNYGQQLSFAITNGNNEGLFKINSATGLISANKTIQYTTNKSVNLTVQVTDNAANPLSSSATITIDIQATGVVTQPTPQNNSPVISNQSIDVSNEFVKGETIAQIAASDPDGAQTLAYFISSGNTSNYFSIDQLTGELISNTDKATIDGQSFNLSIMVADNAANPLTASATLSISIIENIKTAPLNQTPVILDQAFEINTIINANDIIGQVIANDPDLDQQLSYIITQGNEDGLFIINAANGTISAIEKIHFSTDRVATLNIQVTDNASNPLSSNATVSIYIKAIHLNQKPVIANQTFELKSNFKVGTTIAQVLASEPDQNQTLSYAITQGNENSYFSIDQFTGEIIANYDKSELQSQTYSLVVEVSDNASTPLTATATITLAIPNNGKLVKGEVNDVNTKRIVLQYDTSLQTDNLKSTQIIADFTVNNNKVVQNITILGSEIFLDLDSDIQYDDQIVISYSKTSTPIFDANGIEIDSFNDFQIENNLTITNINDPIDNQFTVTFYPNPTNGNFTINGANLKSDICELALYSLSGSLVTKKQLSAAFGSIQESMDVSHINKGTYILHFLCENEIYRNKLVIM